MTKITLVNPNLVKVPAVAPVALDVLNTALRSEGHEIDLLDLTPVADRYEQEINKYFSKNKPNYVGITFRNAWDMVFTSFGSVKDDGSFIPSHVAVARILLQNFPRDRIIAGGVGFSSIPEYMLQQTGLKYGVVGAGDKVFSRIIDAFEGGKSPRGLEGFVEAGYPYIRSPREETLPLVIDRTNFVDNKWYFRNGGLAGLRTSNGCNMKCTYCMEPEVKGGMFLRDVNHVIAELNQLIEQGITDVHIIDSEANIPFRHSKEIKRAIASRNYPSSLRLWEYAQVLPFDEEYAKLARKAGVAGILFSADHIEPQILKAFGKWYTAEDIARTTKICQDNGIKVMNEFLFGMPGETEDSIKKSIDFMRELDPYLTGITLGIGITPSSPLSRSPAMLRFKMMNPEARKREGLYCNGTLFADPTYFVSTSLKIPEIYDTIRNYVGSDIYRFMVPTVQNTSKTDNQLINSSRVEKLIREGKTGAYWAYYRDQWN
ncbi:radical SAM protein [Candidatus Woesearchaeota archaeon]|nr:radical SAM protein [Candidatus Woesearchaeota archaeon]